MSECQSRPANQRPRAATNAETLSELSAALGRRVESLHGLYSGPVTYQAAIPLLVEMLGWETDCRDKEGIARCLAVRAAKGIAGPPLIQEMRRDPDAQPGVLWALANAIEVVVTPDVVDDIVDLAFDERLGHARRMLTLALGHINEPKSVDALVRLLSDPVVDGHAVEALGKLAKFAPARAARGAVVPFATHPVTWKRNAARRTLTRFERYSAQDRDGA